MAAPDYSGVTNDITKGYDYQRQKAAATEGANLQGQKDALARRQAQLGGGPGGAFINAEQQAGNQSAQRLQSANEGIDQQQGADLRNVKMTQLGQQFQSSERESGQQFQAGQQLSGQKFQASQQEAQFAQQGKLQGAQIQAQKIMQDKGINAQSSLQDRQLAAQELMQKTGIDAAAAQQLVGIQAQKDLQKGQQDFQQPFMEAQVTGKYNGQDTEEKRVDDFNMKIAQQMADKKDLLEQLFSNFSGGNINKTFGGSGQGLFGATNIGGGPGGGPGGGLFGGDTGGIINNMIPNFGGGGGGGFSF